MTATQRIAKHGASIALIATMACSSAGKNLEPARAANTLYGTEDAATAQQSGLQIVAQSAKWPGDANIREEVTPMRVRITNNGEEPVRVRYEDFTIIARDGQRFAALPPLQTRGVVDRRTAEPFTPMFGHSGFSVSPYHGYAYPSIATYQGPFAYNAVYYDTYYGYWGETALPTSEMISRALPEGVLAPGGELDGWLYFQRVPEEKERVQFQAKLSTAPASAAASAQGAGKPTQDAERAAQAKAQQQKPEPTSERTIEITIPFRFAE